MPGPVFVGGSAEAAAIWRDGKLLDKDGVGTLLSVRGTPDARGTVWVGGKSATPLWRQQRELIFRGSSAEVHARIVRDIVYRANTSEPLYQLRGDSLLSGNGRGVVVRGAGLSAEERVLAALVLVPG